MLSQLSANKSVQKQFLDEEQNRLLQLFHDLSYEYLCIQQNVSSIENKKEREKEEANVKQTVHKVHKDLIKLTVKISVLAGQKQLTGKSLWEGGSARGEAETSAADIGFSRGGGSFFFRSTKLTIY